MEISHIRNLKTYHITLSMAYANAEIKLDEQQ